jgi:hypothetical protein
MKSDTVAPMSRSKDENLFYLEVLSPPFWLMAFVFFLIASLALSIWAALGDTAGLTALIILIGAALIGRKKVAMKIEIGDGELRIGPAHIEVIHIGEVSILSIEEMRLTRGRNADTRAFLALRFWQPRGIKMVINDDRDPTPYWLVSSKKSNELAARLKKSK